MTWLPKACRRSPQIRKAVAEAILKAMVSVKGAEIVCLLDSYHSNLRVAQRPDPSAVAKAPENLVVRFAEAVDGYPLPKGTPEAAFPIPAQHHTRNTVAGSEPTTSL